MRLTFYGAASEVTGSKHLLEVGPSRVLLDCGLFQGHDEHASDHNRLPFPADSIQAVVISHAHLDHVGLLPALVRDGFRGRIYATSATRDLTELILLDAAKIQEQDADYARRHFPDQATVVPLFTADDVGRVMPHFTTVPYSGPGGEWREVAHGVRIKLHDAGHILGSAVTAVEANDGGRRHGLVYTGDLGRWNAPLLRDPQFVGDPAETLVMDSTYGARRHHPVNSVHQRLVEIVQHVVQLGGKVIVPAFSLGRTQELVYILHQLTDQGRIPRIPIYVDSPLASQISQVYTAHQAEYDAQSRQDFTRLGENPLAFRNLLYTHTVAESKNLNVLPGPMLIISASGMATGGRVRHHLRNTLADSRNVVLFTGYQASRTLGRRLLEGARAVHLFGQEIPVRARLEAVNDLSAHADSDELQRYAEHIDGLQQVFLVHGEPDRAAGLAEELRLKHPDWDVTIPKIGESFELKVG